MPDVRTKADGGETKRSLTASSQQHCCGCRDALAAVQEQVERLHALCLVHDAQLTELEDSNRTLRALHDLDPPPASLKAGFVPVKTASKILGCSISGVHYLASNKIGKLKRRKVGGSVLIEVASIEEYCLNCKTVA